jgi:hypothetical protein
VYRWEGTGVQLTQHQSRVWAAAAHIVAHLLYLPFPSLGKFEVSIMKPVSASDILRRSAPRDFLGLSFAHTNRFETLRESSPAPSQRSRVGSTASVKRKEEEVRDTPVITVTKQVFMDEEDEVAIACMQSNISKVSSICDRMIENLQKIHIEEPLREILGDLMESVKVTNKVQGELVTKLKVSGTTVTEQPAVRSYSSAAASVKVKEVSNTERSSYAQQAKKPRKVTGSLFSSQADERGNFKEPLSSQSKKVETDEEKKVRKFAEAIRDAERSTLCFNLNMGNKPIMNKTTISERATLALTSMAAKVEGKNSVVPSPEIVAALDDVTSLVTSMELFGSNTKQYKGKEKDKDDSTPAPTYCTLPVRYQFKDREQRVFAEKQLRDLCNVKCSTPYPAVVRECIKQVVTHVRETFPDDYIRVSVMVKDFALKLQRRPKGKDLPWTTYPDLFKLPNEALDVSLKKVPEGFKMFYLPSFGENDDEMCTDHPAP